MSSDDSRPFGRSRPSNPHELRLRNPVIAASGCFGYGENTQASSTSTGLVHLSARALPGSPVREPDATHSRVPAGMLNAIGLQNPGIQGFVKKYPAMWAKWTVPAIVNISAESVDDYAMMAAILDEQPAIAAIESMFRVPTWLTAAIVLVGTIRCRRSHSRGAVYNNASGYREAKPRGLGHRLGCRCS